MNLRSCINSKEVPIALVQVKAGNTSENLKEKDKYVTLSNLSIY